MTQSFYSFHLSFIFSKLSLVFAHVTAVTDRCQPNALFCSSLSHFWTQRRFQESIRAMLPPKGQLGKAMLPPKGQLGKAMAPPKGDVGPLDKLTCVGFFNPRPAGPLDFPPPAGGAFERPPPMISAPGRRREKQKAAFENSRKIISKSFRSFLGSGQN